MVAKGGSAAAAAAVVAGHAAAADVAGDAVVDVVAAADGTAPGVADATNVAARRGLNEESNGSFLFLWKGKLDSEFFLYFFALI